MRARICDRKRFEIRRKTDFGADLQFFVVECRRVIVKLLYRGIHGGGTVQRVFQIGIQAQFDFLREIVRLFKILVIRVCARVDPFIFRIAVFHDFEVQTLELVIIRRLIPHVAEITGAVAVLRGGRRRRFQYDLGRLGKLLLHEQGRRLAPLFHAARGFGRVDTVIADIRGAADGRRGIVELEQRRVAVGELVHRRRTDPVRIEVLPRVGFFQFQGLGNVVVKLRVVGDLRILTASRETNDAATHNRYERTYCS